MGDIDLDSYIGMSTGESVITVERGPATAFAIAVKDDKALYRDAEAARTAGFSDVPVPPTWAFSVARNFGCFAEEQPPDATGGVDPMAEVMGGLLSSGGIILHGEQSFTYHRPVVVGEKLHHRGVVKDIYRKPTGDRVMTFMVVEDTYTDDDGEPVLVAEMNLLHRS